jgi:integrase
MQIQDKITTFTPSNPTTNQVRVSFVLHEKVSGPAKLQIIRVNIAVNGERLRKATGESVNARYWDSEKQRVKGKHAQKDSINTFLNDLEEKIYDTFRKAKIEGHLLTAAELWERVRAKPVEVPKNTPRQLYERWKVENRHTYSAGYISNYGPIADHIEAFHPGLTPKQINKSFVAHYFNYLLEDRKEGEKVIKGKQNGTIKLHAGWLRIMLESEGLNKSWLKVNFHSKPAKTWLTREELKQLYDYQPTTQKMQNVKDVFLFFCFTGLRYSDVKQLKPIHLSNINGIPVIKLTQKKTKQAVAVALNPFASEIIERNLNKYKTLFRVYTTTNMNAYLKKLCEAANIIAPVLKVEWRGTERTEIEVPKWDAITCHTGRHTFTTLTLERIDKRHVSKALGHAGGGSIDTYTHHDENERLQVQLDAWKDLN